MSNINTTPRYNIDSCALLAEFNASVWTARKLDRKASDDVVTSNNAKSKDAARVNKHLLAGRTELEVIQSMVNRARVYVYENTLPWSDSGLRLLPTANFIKFTDRMDAFSAEFDLLVEEFVKVYPTLITAQAMALGDMFKRSEYPTPDSIAAKFAFKVNYMPVPTAGDFRVDVGNAAQMELQQRLTEVANERVENAMNEVWASLGDHLRRMSDRLTVDNVDGEEKTRRFHDSLVEGAVDLCDRIKVLNVVGDPALEKARSELAMILVGLTPKDLRKNEAIRDDVKKNVDAILARFQW
jgi:hypothetical protein